MKKPVIDLVILKAENKFRSLSINGHDMRKRAVEINFRLTENKNREEESIVCKILPLQVAVLSAYAGLDSQ
jgi:hypothetical protein